MVDLRPRKCYYIPLLQASTAIPQRSPPFHGDHTGMTRTIPLLRHLALITLLCAFFLAAPGAGRAAEYGSVAKDGVNLRSGPGTDREILWEVFRGFPLQVLGRQGQWAQVVDFEGDKGWIYTPLLAREKTVIIKVNTANMRTGPGTNYPMVATVKYGVVFQPLEKDGEWVKVRHDDGTTGWIFEKLLWPN
jgi:SH3-like domain-containing protein